jgi:hypothetical protein
LEHLNYAFARQLIPLRLTFIMLYVSLLWSPESAMFVLLLIHIILGFCSNFEHTKKNNF